MSFTRALVVDDELVIRKTLERFCQRKRMRVKTVSSISEGLEQLQGDHEYDLLFLDINLPDGNGDDLLEQVSQGSHVPVTIMITGQGSIESAVRCMKLGAFDYIQKPFSLEVIDLTLSKAQRFERLQLVNRQLIDDRMEAPLGMIGESERMKQVQHLIESVARTDATVMIEGETGTGKELIAQELHRRSLRRDKPFIRVNCAAVSESLIESEFFGHEKGAFTGAHQARIGRFELADGGTLLLDEISEISLSFQAKLLRVLQEREFERVGGSQTIKVDVRIVATTNRDLPKEIEEGRFRQDLYYRLNVFPIHNPPLRERAEDIPLLSDYFLQTYRRKHGRKLKRLDPETVRLLQLHDWPGNVRELQNAIERAVLLTTQGETVRPEALPLELRLSAKDQSKIDATEAAKPEPAEAKEPAEAAISQASEEESDEPAEAARESTQEAAIPPDWSLESQERLLILRALEHTGANRTNAADLLGISVRTLRNKLNQYKAEGDPRFASYYKD